MKERMQIGAEGRFVTERRREICMEIRRKICAPILCAAFGARIRIRDMAGSLIAELYALDLGAEDKTIILLLYCFLSPLPSLSAFRSSGSR